MILIHPSIDPVIFSFSFIEIRWYGMAYIVTFITGSFLIKFLNGKITSKLTNKLIDDFFIWSIIGVIFGGRIGYVFFYQIENLILNPIYLFYIWKGGMSFHGGLIGMILAIYFFSKKHNINFFHLSDLVSTVAPIGLFFGRIANFINTELYEAFFEGIFLFLILILIYNKKFLNNNFGIASAVFLFTYGLLRFFIEFLREPDEHIGLFFDYFTMGQILCLPIIFIGIIIYNIKKPND